jgi:hypothetical protein
VEKISRHINELLFDHDCVIVPSLGGFLASSESSHVVMPSHVIFPPYRRIAFNVYLKQNDGLLANHIVKTENIAYPEATRLIDIFTSECFENLDNGKRVNISEVGTLYFDKEKNLQFEAFKKFTHLKDSFGMEPVHFLPVVREAKSEIKKPAPEKILRPSIPQPIDVREKVIIARKGKRYLSAAIIGAALFWVGLNIYLVTPKKYESTSLSPFDSQNISLSKFDSIRNLPPEKHLNQPETSETISNAVSIPAETTAALEVNKPEEVSKTIPEVVTPPVNETEDQKIVSPDQVIKKHYLVAGVFKISENAHTELSNLQRLGFSEAQIIEANGMHYVVYSGFTRFSKAVAFVDSLREKNLEGWVWKH